MRRRPVLVYRSRDIRFREVRLIHGLRYVLLVNQFRRVVRASFGANKSMWYQTLFNFGEYSCYIPGAAHTWYATHVNGYAGGTY
jgi:hypothetical protein